MWLCILREHVVHFSGNALAKSAGGDGSIDFNFGQLTQAH